MLLDDAGKPISTTTAYKNQVQPTADALPSSASVELKAHEPTSSLIPPTPSSSSSLAPALASSPLLLQPMLSLSLTQSSSPKSSEGSSSSGPGFSSGISYTPYNADNSCKSTSQVAQDFSKIGSFGLIRLYGTDCNQVSNVIAATHGSVNLLVGIFDINSVQTEVQTISQAVSGNWGLINTVSVGNELVSGGKASVQQVTAAIDNARSALKSAGYNGPVVTVDTMTAMKDNPSLCTSSDYCAINCHAFFDGDTLPSGAGDFVKDWAQKVSQAAGGKTVVVTESGWPTQGNANKLAIPSPQNQQQAIASLKTSFSSNLVLYTAYNDMWKQDSGATFGAEKYWGILGNSPA